MFNTNQLKQKEKDIEAVDAQADKLFDYCISKWENDIEDYKKRDEEDSIYTKEELIERVNKEIEHLKELKKKYIALKERFKHDSVEKRYALAEDWHDLNEIYYALRLNYEHHIKNLDFFALASKEERNADEDTHEQNNIRAQEIIKRIEKQYSDSD